MCRRSSVFRIAGEIGFRGVSAASEATSNANQILGAHVLGVGIAARLGNFTGDIDKRGLNARFTGVDEQAVARLQQNVIGRIAAQSLPELDGENFGGSFGAKTKHLRGVESRVGSKAACQIDGVT